MLRVRDYDDVTELAHAAITRMPAEQHTELITALHGPWRTATRMVIIVLSAAGMSPSEIADLLHYDPVTVRRWKP